jgi:hypothetical protein
MDPLNLFRVDGMVAVVTGGGTGMLFSFHFHFYHLFVVVVRLPRSLPFTAASYGPQQLCSKLHYISISNQDLLNNPKRLNLALAA